MKKVWLIVMMLLLTACTLNTTGEMPNSKTNMIDSSSVAKSTSINISKRTESIKTTELITQSETTDLIQDFSTDIIPPSYREISDEIQTYFRMFYENNQNYSCSCVEISAQRSTNGGYVIGYFDDGSIVKMISELYGESHSSFTTYYFINTNLTYIIERINYQWPLPREESYQEYFLIDKKLFQYDNKTCCFIESTDTNVIEYFESDKFELMGDETIPVVENSYEGCINDDSFVQFINAQKDFFEKLLTGKKYAIYGDHFHVDVPNYYNYYHSHYFNPQDDVSALFVNSQLAILRLAHFDETSYTGYEFFLIDDTRIYVIVYQQEFKKQEVNFNSMKENYYEEYFIINEKIMKYDSEKHGLMETYDNSNIITNYNLAKENIENLLFEKT